MLVTASGLLLPASGVTVDSNHDGDDIIFDNLVDVASDSILDDDGIGFRLRPIRSDFSIILLSIFGVIRRVHTLCSLQSTVGRERKCRRRSTVGLHR